MANAVVEYGEALYYPHVRFRSREWLRTSVLYHNKIWRIVPPGLDDQALEHGYGMFDHSILDEIRILRDEGIVQNEVVSPVVAKVGADFIDFVKANLADPGRRKNLIPELSADRNQWYRIHPGKMDPKLRDLLHELHLAREVPQDQYGDWDLDATTGGMYMYFLAQALAKNRPIISDNPKYQALAYAPPSLGLNQRGGPDIDKGFTLAVASFETVHPLGIEHVPIETLIKFRNDHQDERNRFHVEIAKLAKDLGNIDHPDQMRDAIEPHAKIVSENTKILKRKLKSMGVDCVRNIFQFSVPGWLATTALSRGILPDNPYFMATTGAVSIGMTVAKYRLDRKNALGESPWSYLLSLRDDITPQQATEDLMLMTLS